MLFLHPSAILLGKLSTSCAQRFPESRDFPESNIVTLPLTCELPSQPNWLIQRMPRLFTYQNYFGVELTTGSRYRNVTKLFSHWSSVYSSVSNKREGEEHSLVRLLSVVIWRLTTRRRQIPYYSTHQTASLTFLCFFYLTENRHLKIIYLVV